uniref:Protein kinase domain-containing protein n=1 Tax=Globisporangium ultimum (strain ATCC 200006 / CBS 805.95 / DAOM BR144) TaxID=431595 RepID=K3WV29_GLOUD
MGLSRLENGGGGCLFPEPEINADKVAYEGLLSYEGSAGKWKERWFVLDADRVALVKCVTSSRQRSRSYALGGDVYIKEVHPLSLSKNAPHPNGASQSNHGHPEPGLAVTTEKGTVIRFRTKSLDEEQKWLAAVAKLSSGFAAGVGDKLAERELLAGKYSLVRELGRGAAGIVSLYTWQGKPFAIKKFLPQKAKPMPNCRVVPGLGGAAMGPPRLTKAAAATPGGTIPDEIRREIALLKKASHLPYVIQLHDVILDPEHGNYYLVMEYMGGGAITEWDSERKCYVSSRQSKSICLLDEATVRRYTTHLLLGIQALHKHRVCHRDIKPENLMANDDKSMCKIGDLGVAHYFKEQENGTLSEEDDVNAIELWDVGDNTNEAATRPASENDNDNDSLKKRKGMLRSTKGTYQFLPPEALSGDKFCGFKADVWSIGVTLYALSFGFLPFFSADLVQLFEKIENDPLVFPHTCQDEDLKDLLSAILDKNPETRIRVEGILNHRWLHRNVDSKALRNEVRGVLKRSSSTLDIGDHDLGLAVSVLQRRFDAMSHDVQRDNVDVDEAIDVSKIAVQIGSVDTTRASGTASYIPRPIVVDDTLALPRWLLKDTELLAAQLHYDWCCAKYVHGWKYGAVRDDAALVHPCLMPMRELAKDEQEKNARCVIETMKCVVALGCHLRQPKSSKTSAARRREVPLTMDKDVTLCWETMMLIDLLAENAHEVWADGYVRNGWHHGPEFDVETRTHPSLKPYMALEEQEKDLSRDAVTSIFKACLCLGYEIKCSRRRAMS